MIAVLEDDGIAAFQKYLNLGGNFIGIHSATDCLNTTEFYGREIGMSTSEDSHVFRH